MFGPAMGNEATDDQRAEMALRISSARKSLDEMSSYVKDETNPVYARDMIAVKLLSELINNWKTAWGAQMFNDAYYKKEQAKATGRKGDD